MEVKRSIKDNLTNYYKAATVSVLRESYMKDQGVPLKEELKTFLSEQINQFKPNLIIVIERKGTAILRTLKELPEYPLEWEWENVISSDSINYALKDIFIGRRILIFDDMLKTGLHMKTVIETLKNKGEDVWNSIKDQIHIATFVIHKTFEESHKTRRPDSWFYHYIENKGYSELRDQIVSMLQKAGSLMLDTEHIEVRIKVNCEYRTFFEALARKAKVIDFHSGANRLNATIYYPDNIYNKFPDDLFPDGTRFSDIVKKCRVVHRGGNQFALIPICYPSIPVDDKIEWLIDSKIKEIFGYNDIECNHNRFQEVGLLAAVEVLKWTLIDIYTLPPEYCQVSLPVKPTDVKEDESFEGFTLSHLNVIYPNLNIAKLTEYINIKRNEAYKTAVDVRSRKLKKGKIESITDEDLYRFACQVIQLIRHKLDEQITIRFLRGAVEKPHPFGLTAREIFSLGRQLITNSSKANGDDIKNAKNYDHIISAVFDILIDNAYLVTHVQEIEDKDGIKRYERTFEPDGEVISEKIRRYTSLFGLPDIQ